MKVIAIAAVTAGGKTTAVREIQRRLPRTAVLSFDDYDFDGAVEDFEQWVLDGADYSVWDLSPLERELLSIKDSGAFDYLLLDYPFAYRHDQIKRYIDLAVFIDTPLDIALARRILRDFQDASAEAIRGELDAYVRHERVAYLQMLKDILPSSDVVVDGAREIEAVAGDVLRAIMEAAKEETSP